MADEKGAPQVPSQAWEASASERTAKAAGVAARPRLKMNTVTSRLLQKVQVCWSTLFQGLDAWSSRVEPVLPMSSRC